MDSLSLSWQAETDTHTRTHTGNYAAHKKKHEIRLQWSESELCAHASIPYKTKQWLDSTLAIIRLYGDIRTSTNIQCLSQFYTGASDARTHTHTHMAQEDILFDSNLFCVWTDLGRCKENNLKIEKERERSGGIGEMLEQIKRKYHQIQWIIIKYDTIFLKCVCVCVCSRVIDDFDYAIEINYYKCLANCLLYCQSKYVIFQQLYIELMAFRSLKSQSMCVANKQIDSFSCCTYCGRNAIWLNLTGNLMRRQILCESCGFGFYRSLFGPLQKACWPIFAKVQLTERLFKILRGQI